MDHHRARLGSGEGTFDLAKRAINQWRMFRISWIRLFSAPKEPQVGDVAAIFVRAFGVWMANVSRVVYLVREEGKIERYGFAYGTLDYHMELGEERFLVEWNHEDDSVWYDLLAFSRPNHWLAKMGGPLTRKFQKRFARDSMEAMQRAAGREGAIGSDAAEF